MFFARVSWPGGQQHTSQNLTMLSKTITFEFLQFKIKMLQSNFVLLIAIYVKQSEMGCKRFKQYENVKVTKF